MSGWSPPLEQAIAGVLERWVTRVSRPGPAEWRFDLGNGKPFPVTAHREDGWLRLVAPAPLAFPEGEQAPWRTLRLNGLLQGPVRLVRHPRPTGLVLQAELPLEDAQLVAARLEALCHALRAASPVLCGKHSGELPLPAEQDAEADSALLQLARERGWQLEQREDNRYSAELDAPGSLSQATLERRGGELRLGIEVLRSSSLSEDSQRAIELFLLRFTALVRMVRGAASEEPAPAIRLEVRLPAAPSGTELELGFSALSLACRLGARELRGLADQLLARTYLDHVTMEE
ncbi:MAG TPA: hypothetical protein VGQ69_10320 [Gemmatimonadales bacterium]|nr:hypothetical protein [Gemmatimonadales bacterium]